MLTQQTPSAQQLQGSNPLDGRQAGRPNQPQDAPGAIPAGDGSGSDWGLAPAKPGISRENKFIMAVLVVLVAVFSFVVFRNFQKPNAGKSETVASKAGRSEKKTGEDGKSSGKEPSKTGDQAGAGAMADADTPDLTQDPFGKTATPDETAPPSQQSTTTGFENQAEPSTLQDPHAPAQLNAGVEENPLDQDVGGPGIPGTTPTEAAPATARRGGRRQFHGQPAQMEVPINDTPDTVDPMAEVAAFNASAEPAGDNGFAQTGGTAGDQIAQTETFLPPREPSSSTDAGTSPRGTSPRNATLSLDPNDEKLGGYREAQLTPSTATPRTAGRQSAAVPPSQYDPQREPLLANSGEYVVRPNDNYWRISRKLYGTARYFAALAKHNEVRIPDPKHIKPGVKIATPPKNLLEQQYGNLLPVMAAPRPAGAVIDADAAAKTPGYFIGPDGQPAYRVGPTDTLSGISQKTLGRSTRWDEIYQLNQDRLAGADTLTVGAILRLPPDASQSRLVGKPVENR